MKGESLDHSETLAAKPDKEGNGRVNNLDSTPKNEELQRAMEQTYQNIAKKPTRRLKDIKSNIAMPALMDLIPKK